MLALRSVEDAENSARWKSWLCQRMGSKEVSIRSLPAAGCLCCCFFVVVVLLVGGYVVVDLLGEKLKWRSMSETFYVLIPDRRYISLDLEV